MKGKRVGYYIVARKVSAASFDTKTIQSENITMIPMKVTIPMALLQVSLDKQLRDQKLLYGSAVKKSEQRIYFK